MIPMQTIRSILLMLFSLSIFNACTVTKQIQKKADRILLQDSVINTGLIGISIYEPSTDKYWYNYNSEKYFIPASNTKLFTLYAGLKYLGDSLTGLHYIENDTSIIFEGTGDPTLLHPDFTSQKVFDFLHTTNKKISITDHIWQFTPYGHGWAWDDYNERYMAERSEMPAFGGVVKINLFNNRLKAYPNEENIFLFPLIDSLHGKFTLQRGRNDNFINIYPAKDSFFETTIPLANVERGNRSILQNAFRKDIGLSSLAHLPSGYKIIKTQATDSLFKIMMHRSDNFFAEQTLLMVSNERLGYMNDEAVIDTLLNSDLKAIPQNPRWVDGCGLSRYNLFSPKSFVYLLNKMQKEFGLERLKNILPTGGEGTLQNYYTHDSLYIYAKTGSLSNNAALSGYLITKKGKLLIFSILTNNFQGKATVVRRSVERFLEGIRNQY